RQSPRDSGEERREAEGDEADSLRGVADILHALGIIAHRVANAPERRAGQRVHRGDAEEAPDRDQIVDFDLRPELQPEQRREPGAIGRDSLLPAEERAQDERARGHELAYAERDHGEDEPRPPGRNEAEQDAEGEAGETPDDR